MRSNRQMYIGIAGVLLALVGLAAMLYPIHLSAYDMYGIKVNCGNGFSADLNQAAETHGGHDVVSQCGNAVLLRRVWAIPTVALGWLLITAFLAMWAHAKKEDAEPPHYVPHPEIARHP